jgi:predicted dehydrogenase
VAIVGCGLIGRKRAQALGSNRLVACADAVLGRAEALAAGHPGCDATADWRAAVARADVDVVIVSTTNDVLTPASLAAVRHGKHVLVEKPAARRPEELAGLRQAAAGAGVVVQVGFNHRYHPALQRAHALFREGAVGPLLYIRARYGHGGRLGYEREWRADPAVAGGGELLDQGVHLIDLCRWFAGDFAEVRGRAATYFWDMPVEDNGFLELRTAAGQVAWLHASCTEWKNLFSFEVFGRTGKLQVDGLGGSYGVETLTVYRMRPEMGPPDTEVVTYTAPAASWREVYPRLLACIREGVPPVASLDDAAAALAIVHEVYAGGGGR